jgi:uncharacterized protein (TIGR03067 family)
MKLGRFAALAALLLMGADPAKDQVVRNEIEELAGMWVLSRTERSNGSIRVGEHITMTIDPNGTVRFLLPDEDSFTTQVADFQFDPTPTPKHYQTLVEEQGRKLAKLGIYELSGDILKFCYLTDRTKRPSKLSVDRDHGGGDTLEIYRRRR